MKIKKIILIFIACFCLTGCTKYISDDNNKRIINEETGQSLPSNILCKPTTSELDEIYNKYKDKLEVDLDKLPECENLKYYDSNNYNGLWVQLIVMPLAWLIIKIGNFLGNYGLSVMAVGLLIRIILIPFTRKTIKQSENMKKAQPEMERLEKKYANKNDQESLMMKSQEMLMIYKKYNISPFGSCLISFIQLPLFFGFLEAINRIPAIFEGDLGAYQLGTTPLIGIKMGNYFYIVLILLIILTTYLSFKFSMSSMGNADQQKQMKMMTGFMLVFISIASFSLPTAIALYWVVTNGFSVVQNLIMKRGKM
ncbi:YidC/Oxa1 family membrane protein insertase [bacterium]|nr:YidC/Oxa1 family membrane protein insertase [bacterium]MDY3756760.1 YidC/Oxa1 family membrane protein insertase [Bacilli bacterium]